MKIQHFKELDSTNLYAKGIAAEGGEEWTVITADTQTNGRGRLGKSFISPCGSGLYMSIILRPDIPPDKACLITTAAAVATAEAIEALSGKSTGIKWVNDIYINNKKVCGILTEACINASGKSDYVILGIGVNLYTPKNGFPDEIKDIAGSVFDCDKGPDIKQELTLLIIKHFKKYYAKLCDKEFLQYYKSRSIIISKEINVISGDTTYPATAVDIDDDFKLIIKKNDGTVTALDSGDVSIRRI